MYSVLKCHSEHQMVLHNNYAFLLGVLRNQKSREAEEKTKVWKGTLSFTQEG